MLLESGTNWRFGNRDGLNICPNSISLPSAMEHDVLHGNPMVESPSGPSPPKVMKFEGRVKAQDVRYGS